jgi:hypothetical protein
VPSIQLAIFDVDALRTRLRKMSDEELLEFGKAARYMVSPKSKYGESAAASVRAAIRRGPGRVEAEALAAVIAEIKDYCASSGSRIELQGSAR